MKKYIVIASGGVGGAEKRFFDVFLEMRKTDVNVYLVVPSCLLSSLKVDMNSNIQDGIIAIKLNSWSPLKFMFKLYFTLILKSNRCDSFHYPLNPLFFLHLLPFRNFSLSFCYCYEIPRPSLKNKALFLQWIASFFATQVDVLNETIFNDFKATNPRLSGKLKLTPGGTFISTNNNVLKEKSNNIVFLSRLEDGKGVRTLFKLIPRMDQAIRSVGRADIAFDIYGIGTLEPLVLKEVEDLVSQGIKVKYHGFVDSSEVFPTALAVLSLQEKTNYPSRVVAEALTSGCQAIILNTGDSRNFGDELGIHYLDKDFCDLSQIAKNIISSGRVDQEKISISASKRYSSSNYIDYYSSIFIKRGFNE